MVQLIFAARKSVLREKAHKQKQSLSYNHRHPSNFTSFLSLSSSPLQKPSKMAQNRRTPSLFFNLFFIIMVQFLYAFVSFILTLQIFWIQIRCQTSSPLLWMQQRELARFVNSSSKSIFCSFYSFSSSFVLLRLINV